MVDDCNPAAAITVGYTDDSDTVRTLGLSGVFRVVLLNDFDGDLVHTQAIMTLPRWQARSDIEWNSDGMYVQYTSGSTGLPKGVLGSYNATVNRLNASPSYSVNELVLKRTPSVFVDSVVEILDALFHGAGLFASSNPDIDIVALVNLAAIHSVTRMLLLPSQLLLVMDHSIEHSWSTLRFIFVSGEAVRPQLLSKFKKWSLNSTQLISYYGSTETAGDACYASGGALMHVSRNGVVGMPLGVPLAHCDVWVDVLVDGDIGELLVAGACVCRYYNNDALNKEKFVYKPVNPQYERWFRTGDLGFKRNDGYFFWVGRCDNQRKLRGIRVELEQIDLQLSAAVGSPVVVVVVDQWLIAFSAESSFMDKIKDIHGAHRPHHHFLMNSFPHTASGKIDRKQLEKVAVEKLAVESTNHGDVFEGTDKVEDLLKQILPLLTTMHETFTNNGGDSMTAIEASYLLAPEFEVSPMELMSSLTLHELFTGSVERTGKITAVDRPTKRFKPAVKIPCDKTVWQVELLACIDAVAVFLDGFVYVGSHGGDLIKVQVDNGEIVWSVKVPGRIQNKVLIHNNVVIASCFKSNDIHMSNNDAGDCKGAVVFVDSITGQIQSQVDHSSEIKSTACIHDGLVWVGTYDESILIVDPRTHQVVNVLEVDGHIACSLLSNQDKILACTIYGEVVCFSNFKRLWTQRVGPVFGDAVLIGESMCVGSVDRHVYAFNIYGGILWKVPMSKPVFASLMSIDETDLVVGCHDCCLRRIRNGEIVWSVELDAAIATQSCVVDLHVVAVTTSGSVYIVNKSDGGKVGIVKLPAEGFAAPVAVGNDFIVIGCRDNWLRKLKCH